MRLLYFFLSVHFSFTNLCFAQPVIMYPGDTNNDGVANHYDLLPIGVAYGKTGPPRVFPSPDWSPQLAQPWAPQVLPVSQIDLAFVDCDGNGHIDSLDIAVIASNYDSTQSNAIPPPFPYIERLTQFCFTCPQPEIVVTFDQDTVGSPDTFSATFVLRYPPGVPPQLGAMGIAFDIEYDYDPGSIIDSLTQVFPDTLPDNRMYVIATHTEVVSSGLLPPPGRIGFAASGRGENVYFMTEPLFTTKFIIDDMVIREDGVAEPFSFIISNVLILNAQEQIIGLGGIIMDTVIVAAKDLPGMQPVVQLSPNPVREMLTVESPDAPMEQLEIFNLHGERVISQNINKENRLELPVAALPPGMWLVAIQTKKGMVMKKFLKAE